MRPYQPIVLLACLVSGCALQAPNPVGRAVTRTPVAEINDRSLKTDYAAERVYRSNKDEPLRLGLALSGGGTKSGMFAHGVLHGLHNAGILHKVDAISTVSGGGYAAYWYFTKMLEADRRGFQATSIFDDCMPTHWVKHGANHPKIIVAMNRGASPTLRKDPDPAGYVMPACKTVDHFDLAKKDPYRWQAHLVRWPDVFATTPIVPDGTPQSMPKGAMAQGIFNGLLFEPLLQVFKHQSAIPHLYQWGIERTWGLNPNIRDIAGDQTEAQKWTYSNGIRIDNDEDSPWRVDPNLMTWNSLRSLHEKQAQRPTAAALPLWIVNTNSGGKSRDAERNLTHNFEQTPFGSGGDQFGFVNNIDAPPIHDLGTSVRASAGFADAQGLTSLRRKALGLISLIVPGARWGVRAKVLTSSGDVDTVRLSDGGGADNLGLYALLKRGVKDIIVVDGAEDIEGDLGDLCAVKAALKDKVVFSFKTLEKLEEVCAGKAAYNVSDWKSPIVEGTATWTAGGRQSRIWLIKAAWYQRGVVDSYDDEKCGDVGRTNCLLTVFYGHNSTVRMYGKDDPEGNMVFPQLPTAGSTADSSSFLFWGYRELGRSIAHQLGWDEVNSRLTSTSVPCLQPAAVVRKNDRPYSFYDPRVLVRCPARQ